MSPATVCVYVCVCMHSCVCMYVSMCVHAHAHCLQLFHCLQFVGCPLMTSNGSSLTWKSATSLWTPLMKTKAVSAHQRMPALQLMTNMQIQKCVQALCGDGGVESPLYNLYGGEFSIRRGVGKVYTSYIDTQSAIV